MTDDALVPADEPVRTHTYDPTQVGYWLCHDARLPTMRERLAGFEPGLQSIVLSGADYALFWPYVSNVWNRNTCRNKLSLSSEEEEEEKEEAREGHMIKVSRIEYFECKFRREWKRRGNGVRSTVATGVPPCQAYLKTTLDFVVADGEATDRIERVLLEFSHPHSTHDLEACDKHKINDGILFACEETLISHDVRKDRAQQAWKADKASKALADLCGLRKHIGSREWDNWERRFRKLARRTTGRRSAP